MGSDVDKKLKGTGVYGALYGALFGNSVYSVLKRMKEREQRLNDMKYKTKSEITNFKVYD